MAQKAMPPYSISGPLRSARQVWPPDWISTPVSTPCTVV
jgi:hypothetical protein